MKDREKFSATFPQPEKKRKIWQSVCWILLIPWTEAGHLPSAYLYVSFAAQVGQTIAAHMKTVAVKTSGGYHEAERIRVAFARNDYDGPVDFGLTALKVTWDDRYRLIGHRDVLGALMGLGIDRAVLGDILMQGRGARLWQTVPWRNGLSGIS